MPNDLTPIEGKGGEMIPERGLPFEEESAEDDSFEFQDSIDQGSIEDILNQAPAEIIKDTTHLVGQSEDGGTVQQDTQDTPEQLLDLEEIRGREMELSEDSHTAPPDFEGIQDGDFATARIPISLPSVDREAIMLESGAGIIEEETPLLFSSETFEMSGPTSPEEEAKAFEKNGDLKAAKKMLELLVTNRAVESLWKRADDLQADVIENIEDLSVARSLLEHIQNARTRLLEKKENYEKAEKELNEVEFRLSYSLRSRQWRGLGYGILAYEIVWGLAFLIGTGSLLLGGENSLRIQESTLISRGEIFIGLGGILWGGIGGVVGALHALWRYTTSERFNPQYNIWYLSQPVMGGFIGAFIFLLIKIGFNVLAGNTTVEIGSPWVVYLLGFIGGFQQNVLYDSVKQVLKLFKPDREETKSTSKEVTG